MLVVVWLLSNKLAGSACAGLGLPGLEPINNPYHSRWPACAWPAAAGACYRIYCRRAPTLCDFQAKKKCLNGWRNSHHDVDDSSESHKPIKQPPAAKSADDDHEQTKRVTFSSHSSTIRLLLLFLSLSACVLFSIMWTPSSSSSPPPPLKKIDALQLISVVDRFVVERKTPEAPRQQQQQSSGTFLHSGERRRRRRQQQ